MGDGENTTNVYRLKLNLSEVPMFSLFEGEIVVAEGFNDSNSRFNVNRLHKPDVIPPKELQDFSVLQKCYEMQSGKAIQMMVASGPFSSRVNLCYDSLQDLMGTVRRDQPHVLILLGPFIDTMNEDVKEGIISYRDADGQLEYLEYSELFTKIQEYIMGEISQNTIKTQLVIVPSAREIEHLCPLPQPAYTSNSFPTTSGVPRPVLLGNPSTFKINDITVGIVNTDIIKDICGSILTKQCNESKIDLSLKSILQQRTYYPIYPGNPSTPIEWEQY